MSETSIQVSIQEEDVSVDVDRLLYLVQNNPPIYNSSLKEHHNLDIMSKIWNDFGKELNVSGNICKKKWTSLRGSYVRYLKELKKTPCGSGQKRKKWHLFDSMSFLQPFTGSTRKMTGNLDTSSERATDFASSQDTNGLLEGGIEDEPSQVSKEQNNFNPQKKKQRRTTADIVAAPMVEYLKTVTEKRKAEENKVESAMLTFFKSLVPDAETLTPKRQRQLKSSVLSKLNSLLDEQETEQTHYDITSPASIGSSTSSTFNQQLRPQFNQVMKPITYNYDENETQHKN